MLARALLAQGKTREAQTAADRALSLAHQTCDVIAGFETDLAAQAVSVASRKFPEAAKALESVRIQADHQGFAGFDLEARLALAEIEMLSGRANSGRAHLQELQNDARSKGFLLIARKAKALESAHPSTTN